MGLADDIIDRQIAARASTTVMRKLYEQIAERIDIQNPILGSKRYDMSMVTDSEPMRLIKNLTSSIEDIVTPHNTKWSEIGFKEEGKARNINHQRYAEQMGRIVENLRYATNSGYARNKRACYRNLSCYGHELLLSKEQMGKNRSGAMLPLVSFQSIPVTQADFTIGYNGVVDALYYRHKKTATQLANDPELSVSQDIQKASEDNSDRNKEFEIIWAVFPNPSSSGYPFLSVWVEVESRHVMKQSGFFEFPFSHSDMEATDDALPFAFSPAMLMLPDVKFQYTLKEVTIVAAEQRIAPSFMTSEELDFEVDTTAFAIMQGALDEEGRPKVQPLITGADPMMGERWMEITSNDLKASAHMDLFQVLVNKPNQSATEAYIRDQEKGALLGPVFSNQETALSAETHRLLRIAERMGERGLLELPDRPFGIGPDDLLLVFKNPLSRLRRMGEARAIMQTIETATQLETHSPGVTARKVNVDKAIDVIAEINGTPANILRTEEEAEEVLQQQQQQAQANQESAQGVAQAEIARNLAPFIKAQSEANQ